uniref:Uncharacterized protein n=1 Tax=Arundo donax TaxID=35708 RepID=A0A0A9AEX5_ARUDO
MGHIHNWEAIEKKLRPSLHYPKKWVATENKILS